MLKNLSRKRKNILLLIVNSVFGLIILRKLLIDGTVSSYLKVWLVMCVLVILAFLIKIDAKMQPTLRDLSLFLLTGGSIGKTVGSLIRSAVSPIELVWLVVAIGAAIVHYSPSDEDKYLN